MTATRDGRDRRVLVLVRGAVAVATASAVLTVGPAMTTTDASSAATKPSYCSASRAVDDYRGIRTTTVRALLGRALRLAPREIAPTIRSMRAAPEPSLTYDTARAVWSRYNTDNCCTCLGGPNAPHLLVSPEP